MTEPKATGPKETVYDAEISPLVAAIQAVCEREDIPFVMQFQLDHDPENGPMACTSAYVPDGAARRMHALASFARNGFVAMVIGGRRPPPSTLPPPPAPPELPS